MASHDAQPLSMKLPVNTTANTVGDSLEAASLPTRPIDVARPLIAGEIGLTIADRSERARFEVRPLINGVMEFVVTAESAAARVAAAVWAAASTLAKKPGFIAAAAALGMGEVAKGALIPDGANDAAYVSYGSSFEDRLLQFKLLVPGVGTGQRNTSATYLTNDWAITAAHNVSDLQQYSPTSSVSTGNNFVTNLGTTVVVDKVILYPGYNGGFESPDIALLHLASPLAGSNAVISSVALRDLVTEAGFGQHGTPSMGAQPNDHNSRAWDAPVVSGNPSDVSDTYYFSTDFAAFENVAMNGKGLSGDSGGPVYNSFGDLVGIGIAQQGNFEAIGSTEALILSQPDIQSWISANTDYGSVPEPTAVAILGMSASAILLKRRR